LIKDKLMHPFYLIILCLPPLLHPFYLVILYLPPLIHLFYLISLYLSLLMVISRENMDDELFVVNMFSRC
jgi:hypothetical protein